MPLNTVRPLLINFAIIFALAAISLGVSAYRLSYWVLVSDYYYGFGTFVGMQAAQVSIDALCVFPPIILILVLRSTSNKLDQGLINHQSNALGKQLHVALIMMSAFTLAQLIIGLVHFAWYGHWLHIHIGENPMGIPAAEIAIWVLLCMAQITSVGLLVSASKTEKNSMLEQQQQRERDLEEADGKCLNVHEAGSAPFAAHTLERDESLSTNIIPERNEHGTPKSLSVSANHTFVNHNRSTSPPAASNPLFRSLHG